MAWGTWVQALLRSESGRSKTYVYYFDHYSPQARLGLAHGAEYCYVVRNLEAPCGPAGLRGPLGPEDTALSRLMMSYWVNFAKTGDPNGSGPPHWPAFSASSQRVMYLDTRPFAGPVPNARMLKTLDAYFSRMRDEAKKKQAN